MPDAAHSLEQSKELLDRAVRDFTPSRREKYQMLLPFVTQIAELRRKRASCRVIAAVLQAATVRVSHDTVARFCRDVIEASAARPTKRQGAVRKPSAPRREPTLPATPKRQSVVSSIQKPRSDEPSASPPRPRGPRIADPRNV